MALNLRLSDQKKLKIYSFYRMTSVNSLSIMVRFGINIFRDKFLVKNRF